MYSQPVESVEPTQQQLLDANIELFAHASAIPLQNRLRYLVGDEELEALGGYRYIELDELAAKIGALPEDLIAIMLDLNIPYEKVRADDEGNISLASGIDAVVADEHEWRKAYDTLPDEVTAFDIAHVLEISDKTVTKILKSTGIISRRVTFKGTAAYKYYYPKFLAYRVRSELLMFPPARQNKTLHQSMGEIGCGHTWVANQDTSNFVPDLMRAPNGRVTNHYTPEFHAWLAQLYGDREDASTHLRTVPQIADDLGRNVDWVEPRLLRYHRRERREFRHGVEYAMYDDDVFQALRKESERQASVPTIASHEGTLGEIVTILDTTYETAGRVLRQLGIPSVERRSRGTGMIVPAYDMGICATLAAAIIKDREDRIAAHELTIAELGVRSKQTLTSQERKQLGIARQQIKTMPLYLERARRAYDNLIKA